MALRRKGWRNICLNDRVNENAGLFNGLHELENKLCEGVHARYLCKPRDLKVKDRAAEYRMQHMKTQLIGFFF